MTWGRGATWAAQARGSTTAHQTLARLLAPRALLGVAIHASHRLACASTRCHMQDSRLRSFCGIPIQSKARCVKRSCHTLSGAAQLPQALEAGMQVPHSRLRKQLRAEPTRHVALRASSAVADGPAPARAGQPPVRGSQGLTGTGPGVPRLEPCQVRSLRRGCRLRLSGTSAACQRAAGGAGRAAHASAPAPSTALSLGGRVRRSPVDDPRPRRRLDARRVRLGLHAVRRSVRLVSAKAPLQVLRTHLLQRVLLSSV